MKLPLIILIALILTGYTASADVVEPGVVSRQFTISNTAKFKGFSFYRLYYRYHYDRGYKAYPPDTLAVEVAGAYAAGNRDAIKSVLLAKDRAGRWYKTTAILGGSSSGNPSVTAITDFYEVVSISKGVIKLKKTKEAVTYRDGIKKEFLPGIGLDSVINRDNFTRSLLLSSVVAMIAMLLFFVWRKRRMQIA
jgi:hypothetical protein